MTDLSQPWLRFGSSSELIDMTHEFEPVSHRVIGATLAVHHATGPGFREAIYQKAMGVALGNRGISFVAQMPVSVMFEGVIVGRHRT
jgi:GxxExxY protein